MLTEATEADERRQRTEDRRQQAASLSRRSVDISCREGFYDFYGFYDLNDFNEWNGF